MYQGADFENFLWYLDHVHRRHSRRLRPPDRHCVCPDISAPSGAEYQVVILNKSFSQKEFNLSEKSVEVQPFAGLSRRRHGFGGEKGPQRERGKSPGQFPAATPPVTAADTATGKSVSAATCRDFAGRLRSFSAGCHGRGGRASPRLQQSPIFRNCRDFPGLCAHTLRAVYS
jgi:hypothetical protein